MTDSSRTATVTAFFDSRDDAMRARDRLAAIGVPRTVLHLTEGRPEDAPPEAAGNTHGFFEALKDFFFPDDDRAAYAEGLSRGGYLLTARSLAPDLYDTAVDVLDDEGAVDIDERASEWRSSGWQSFTSAQTGAPSDILSGTGGGEVEAGTSGMAGMDTPHAGVTADRDAELRAESGESRGMITDADRRGDLWQRDMSRGRGRVRTYLSMPPVTDAEDDAPDATERNNLPS